MSADQLFGTSTVVLCFAIYFYSWKYQQKDNYKIAVALLIISGLILRIYSSSYLYLHDWDERYHALVAKNFMKHFFVPTLYDHPVLHYYYNNWDSNHIWLHKQPLSIWAMTISMWLFGINEIAIRIPSIVITTIAIWLTYYIANFFFNKKVAYYSAFLYSINGLIIELVGGRTATDHVDVFFLFFIELSIFLSIVYVQKQKTIYTILVGVSIGAAILSKWLPALIVLPVWLLLVIDSKKFNNKKIFFQFVLMCTVAAIVFLPWQIYIFQAFPVEANWEASFNVKHLTQVFENQQGPFYYYLTMMRLNYGELIYLPLIWFLWKSFKKPFDLKRLAICVWVVVPVLFFTVAQTKMQAYILFICPALFIITAEFFVMLLNFKIEKTQKWLIRFIIVIMIVIPFRYLIERVRPLENIDRNPKWATDLKGLNSKNYKNAVLLNYNRPIEAMFYTDITAYNYLPNDSTINSLMQKGYTIIINDNGKVPMQTKTIKGLKMEHLEEFD